MTATARPLEKGHAYQYPMLRTVRERREKTQSGICSRSHALRHCHYVGAGRARDDRAITLQSPCKYRGHGPLLRSVDVLNLMAGTLQRPEPQSGSGCIPTQSVGTMKYLRNTVNSSFPRGAWERGVTFSGMCGSGFSLDNRG